MLSFLKNIPNNMFNTLDEMCASAYVHQVRHFPSADVIYMSEHMVDAKNIWMNVGSFSACFYRSEKYLRNLKMALNRVAAVSIIFGPALYIKDNIKLFKIFKEHYSSEPNTPGKVTLYYRQNIDKEGEWDQKHFGIVNPPNNDYNAPGTFTSLRIERKHNEYTPDSQKEYTVLSCPLDKTSYYTTLFKEYKDFYGDDIFKFYRDKFKELCASKEVTVITEISNLFNTVGRKARVIKGTNRYKGPIIKKENGDPVPATSEDINKFEESLKEEQNVERVVRR